MAWFSNYLEAAQNSDAFSANQWLRYTDELDACRERLLSVFRFFTNGLVLTDDFNPAEFYDAQNREATRRNQMERVRRM